MKNAIRIIYKIRKHLARFCGKKRVKLHNGVWFLLDPMNWIDNRIIAGYGYEEMLVENMFSAINKYKIDVMLDIGANIGYYSLLAAKHCDVKEIYAFEPVRRNLYQFYANQYLNGFENRIITYDCGLSDKKDKCNIYIDPRSTGVSRLSLEHAQRNTKVFTQQEVIKLEVLDSLLPLTNRNVFIKIDTEGHEFSVLLGMLKFLEENNCFIHIEVSPENDEKVGEMLNRLGYNRLNNIDDNVYYSNFCL